MNADIQGKLDAIKAPFQSVIEATDAIPALVDASEKVQYDAGFAAGEVSGIEKGKAMIELPSPTLPDGTVDPSLIYNQQQMNDAVTSGKAQQKAEDDVALQTALGEKDLASAQLAAQVQDLQNQLDAATQKLNAKDAQMSRALGDLKVVESDLGPAV